MTLLIIVPIFLYPMHKLRRSMYVHDALCHSMWNCVYAHCTCKWGTQVGHASGARGAGVKLCAAGLVGA